MTPIVVAAVAALAMSPVGAAGGALAGAAGGARLEYELEGHVHLPKHGGMGVRMTCLLGPVGKGLVRLDVRDAVLLECGHGGICYACARRCLRKKGRECPMCRAPVEQVVQIRLDGAPASPQPFTPSGLVVQRTPASVTSNEGKSSARGMQ